jgi:hypothetical protein
LTNLLIPADLVSELRIPDVAVSSGEPGGVWCDRSWGRWILSRRYVLRLPYDAVAAAKLRKLAVLNRVYVLFAIADLTVLAWRFTTPEQQRWSSPWPMIMNASVAALLILKVRWNVAPEPSRTRRGDLYLPGLPPAVAQLWLQSNPAAQVVDRKPAYRRWPPWVYAGGALLSAALTIGLARCLFSGRDVPLVPLLALPAVVAAALTLAYLALPTGHSRLSSAP